MIRRTLFALILSVCVLGTSRASADVIYDAITNQTFSFTGSLPRTHLGDPVNNIAAPINKKWRVDVIDMNFVVGAAGTFNNVTARIRVWDNWDPAAPAGTHVFSNLLSDVTWTFGDITTTGVSGFSVALPYVASGLGFNLNDTQLGFEIEWRVNGVLDDNLTTGITNTAGDVPPVVGSTALDGYYRDVNNDGIFDASDARDLATLNTNLMLRINATAIPEPSTMALAAVGLVGLVALRRRRKTS
jgi:MYXO-CTERM domain-containing protein